MRKKLKLRNITGGSHCCFIHYYGPLMYGQYIRRRTWHPPLKECSALLIKQEQVEVDIKKSNGDESG
jgi:hypothetical protein